MMEIHFAGEGAKDVKEGRPTSTQPPQPSKTAGPLVGPKGVDQKGAISGGTAKSYDAVRPNPGTLGGAFVSPVDK
jgi:hypothetical protein